MPRKEAQAPGCLGCRRNKKTCDSHSDFQETYKGSGEASSDRLAKEKATEALSAGETQRRVEVELLKEHLPVIHHQQALNYLNNQLTMFE
jgi:hypothetical protein